MRRGYFFLISIFKTGIILFIGATQLQANSRSPANSNAIQSDQCDTNRTKFKNTFNDCSGKIEVIVASGAGGGTDTTARVIAGILGKDYGVTAVVTNKAGASGNLAATTLVSASKPQCTVMMAADTVFTVNPHTKTMKAPAMKDFAPISILANYPWLIAVRSDSNFKTIQDLVEAMKRNEKINMAVAGNLSPEGQIARQWIPVESAEQQGTAIAYHNSTMESLRSLTSDSDVQVAILSPGTAAGQLKGNRPQIRVLAKTSDIRLPGMPDLPTLGNYVEGFPNMNSWTGLVASAKMDSTRVQALEIAMRCIVQSEHPNIKGQLQKVVNLGYRMQGTSGDQMLDIINQQKTSPTTKQGDAPKGKL